MRFNRQRRYGAFEDNNRKRAALARKQRLERESLPLFAEQIAAEQPDADTVMAERAVQWDQYEQSRRAQKAARWREARRRLFGYGDNVRGALRRLWNAAPYPGTPEYLLGMLHSYDVGRIDPDAPPWVYRGPGLNKVDLVPIINRSRERMGMPPIVSLDDLPKYGSPPPAPATNGIHGDVT